jgi:hypothetical protein
LRRSINNILPQRQDGRQGAKLQAKKAWLDTGLAACSLSSIKRGGSAISNAAVLFAELGREKYPSVVVRLQKLGRKQNKYTNIAILWWGVFSSRNIWSFFPSPLRLQRQNKFGHLYQILVHRGRASAFFGGLLCQPVHSDKPAGCWM